MPAAPNGIDEISATQSLATGVYVVTTSADAGPGSLRDGLARASADSTIGTIRFGWDLTSVMLASPVVYTGPQALKVEGSFAHLVGPSCPGCDAIISTGDADLTFEKVTIRDARGSGVSVRVNAGVTLVVRMSRIQGNGFGGPNDFDGIRVGEGGVGDLHMTLDRGSIGFNSGAGIDADEDDAGTGTLVLIQGGVHGNA
jgi:hypothetical protein